MAARILNLMGGLGPRFGRILVAGCLTLLPAMIGCDGRPASQSRWWGGPQGGYDSSGASRMHVEDMLDTWVGAHGQDLMDSWGNPHRTERRHNGEWWLFYRGVESYDQRGPDMFTVWFLADSQGTIYAYEWDYDDQR